MKEIIFIGDSLIEWFDWDKRFPEHRVHNLGISGETVEMPLNRLPNVIKKHPHADMVFLMTGINNVAMEDTEIFNTYRSILQGLGEGYPDADIHLTSLLPTLLPWIPNSIIEQLNTVISDIAGESGGVSYDDVYSLFVSKGARECLSEDGIHISEIGYKVWSDALEPLIARPGA